MVRVLDDAGATIDTVRLRIGIRSLEFRGKDGLILNGKPFDGKLIGTNRHQDYAYVGHAVSNHAHWRDAVRLRQAGMRVIRSAHYPQDPAFMDACDALGMFVIITTPGWQFWNDQPPFEERVLSDIRNMVRRDRNRPSVFLWEPILNETNYPDCFARRVHEITHEEYPHPGCYTACDLQAEGQECFDVIYAHVFPWDKLVDKTEANTERRRFDYTKENRCIFTREWGDCVMDWRAQSSASRVAKGWGERPQLVQAKHYADPDYLYTCLEALYAAPAQHVGGTLWHGVDHYRGYHADPFWGGILDATRQPKFSYHMFCSQVDPELRIPHVQTGPFVYIAHIMHPISEPDVTVFSNCEEVRLICNGEVVDCKTTRPEGKHMPHYPVVFADAFRARRHGVTGSALEAEGLIGGKVVARATRRAWDRRERLTLRADLCGIPLQADGADFVPVVASIVDKTGEVIRLTDDTLRFSVEGPAEVIGEGVGAINPQKLVWGEAVVLVRAGTAPGQITVRAEPLHPGPLKPLGADISLRSVAAHHALPYTEEPEGGGVLPATRTAALSVQELQRKVAELSSQLHELKIRDVEKQQEDFA
jgi:beta-galactosidase